jgi:hypothetical protein
MIEKALKSARKEDSNRKVIEEFQDHPLLYNVTKVQSARRTAPPSKIKNIAKNQGR